MKTSETNQAPKIAETPITKTASANTGCCSLWSGRIVKVIILASAITAIAGAILAETPLIIGGLAVLGLSSIGYIILWHRCFKNTSQNENLKKINPSDVIGKTTNDEKKPVKVEHKAVEPVKGEPKAVEPVKVEHKVEPVKVEHKEEKKPLVVESTVVEPAKDSKNDHHDFEPKVLHFATPQKPLEKPTDIVPPTKVEVVPPHVQKEVETTPPKKAVAEDTTPKTSDFLDGILDEVDGKKDKVVPPLNLEK